MEKNKPGGRILQNRTSCPSCKKYPVKGLAFMDPNFKILLSNKITYDYDWHYAWCKLCLKPKEYMTKDCGGPDPMAVVDFVCEDCKVPNDAKNCPSCGILTSKSGGCNHIICTIFLQDSLVLEL